MDIVRKWCSFLLNLSKVGINLELSTVLKVKPTYIIIELSPWMLSFMHLTPLMDSVITQHNVSFFSALRQLKLGFQLLSTEAALTIF